MSKMQMRAVRLMLLLIALPLSAAEETPLNRDLATVASAAASLRAYGDRTKATEILVAAVGSKSPDVKRAAIEVLWENSIFPPELIETLLPLTRSDNLQLADGATRLLLVTTPAREIEIPFLTQNLRSNDEFRRAMAARSAGTLRERAAVTLPDLLKLTSDRETRVRANAVRSAAMVGSDSANVTAVIAKATTDPEIDVRAAAADAASFLRGTTGLEFLATLLRDRNDFVRGTALHYVLDRVPDHDATELALDVLASGEADVSYWLSLRGADPALALRRPTKQLVPMLPWLAEVARRFDQEPRRRPKVPPEAIAVGLASSEPRVRASAAVLAGYAGRDALSVTERLAGLVSDLDPAVRAASVSALARIGEATPSTVATLTNAAHRGSKEAIDVLGSLGPAGAIALIAELQGTLQASRRSAASALSKSNSIGSGPLPQLIPFLGDHDVQVARDVALAIRRQADAGVMALSVALTSAVPAVRSAAARTLCRDTSMGNVGPLQPVGDLRPIQRMAITALVPALEDRDPEVRRAAARSMGTYGELAVDRIGALRPLLGDDVEYVRITAGLAMRRLASFSIAPLVSALDDDSPMVRRGAIQTLATLYGDAGAARPDIELRRGDSDVAVRAAAEVALSRIAITPIAVGRTIPPVFEGQWKEPDVELRIVVDEQGRVADVRIENGIDDRTNLEAIASATAWRFKPASMDGKPVTVYLQTSEYP